MQVPDNSGRGSEGGGLDVDDDPALLPSFATAGVGGDCLGVTNCASVDADGGNNSIGRSISGVKGGISVEG